MFLTVVPFISYLSLCPSLYYFVLQSMMFRENKRRLFCPSVFRWLRPMTSTYMFIEDEENEDSVLLPWFLTDTLSSSPPLPHRSAFLRSSCVLLLHGHLVPAATSSGPFLDRERAAFLRSWSWDNVYSFEDLLTFYLDVLKAPLLNLSC